MKKKDKYKIINYAIKEYSDKFKRDYARANISQKQVKELLKMYKHSGMAEWSYCCYGLYQNCWQEPFEEGVWGITQSVWMRLFIILYTNFKSIAKETIEWVYLSKMMLYTWLLWRETCLDLGEII